MIRLAADGLQMENCGCTDVMVLV